MSLAEHNPDTVVPFRLNLSKLLVSYAITKLLQNQAVILYIVKLI